MIPNIRAAAGPREGERDVYQQSKRKRTGPRRRLQETLAYPRPAATLGGSRGPEWLGISQGMHQPASAAASVSTVPLPCISDGGFWDRGLLRLVDMAAQTSGLDWTGMILARNEPSACSYQPQRAGPVACLKSLHSKLRCVADVAKAFCLDLRYILSKSPSPGARFKGAPSPRQ